MKEYSTWQKKFRVNTWTKIHRRRILRSISVYWSLEKKKKRKKNQKKKNQRELSSEITFPPSFPFLSFPFFPRLAARRTGKNTRALFPRHRFFLLLFLSFLFFPPLYRRFILESHRAGRMQATNNYGWTRRFEGPIVRRLSTRTTTASRIPRRKENGGRCAAAFYRTLTPRSFTIPSTSSAQPSRTHLFTYSLAHLFHLHGRK